MGRGRDFYDSAKKVVQAGTAKVRGHFAERQAEAREREQMLGTDEMRKTLDDCARFADHLGNKYKGALKDADKTRKRRIAGAGGAIAGATVYGLTLHGTVKGWTNTFYNDAMALRDLVKNAQRLVPGGEQSQIKGYLGAHKGLAESLGITAKQYQNNINSVATTLKDVRVAADDLGRIAQGAPGYNSPVMKELSGLRNRITEKLSRVVTGQDQSDRLTQEYNAHFNALNGMLRDAANKKGDANKKILEILKQTDALEASGQQILQREKGELEKFMAKYNAYTKLIDDFGKLSPAEIKTKGSPYRELVNIAEKNDLSLPLYRDVGTMVSMGAGLLAAYVAGRTSSRWLSWMIPSKKFNPEKEARQYLEHVVGEEQRGKNLESRAGGESRKENWSGYDIAALAISMAMIALFAGMSVSGFAVHEKYSGVISFILVIASLFLLAFSIRKIYKIGSSYS